MEEIKCLKLKEPKIISIDDKEFYINNDNIMNYITITNKTSYIVLDYNILYKAKDGFIHPDKEECIKHENKIIYDKIKDILDYHRQKEEREYNKYNICTFIINHIDEIKKILNED